MPLQIVRFTTPPDLAGDVEHGIAELFGAVHAARPAGLRYLAARLTDRPEFLLLLGLPDGTPTPLPEIPQTTAFRARMAGWADADPAPRPLTVLGDYRMLG
ncbi:hypothetical protein Sme01_05200 [Sphaerisporangium melleum]|uniref:Uncharacterized protein n=1 Tax=Sphaerisporangium melleum TaxID=321316 RepID=A0A917QQG1_9ACTN|nr:hypothetical protein [Sphaerisporangium melleum]GGK63096.1 hypothetical protein GCM10007964_02770 [Sphaerisporangium melleum]GII68044.1 hypothetical protein Sme01_05200 [Sphaerisporangium melleum]